MAESSNKFFSHPTFGAPIQEFILPIIVKIHERIVPVGTGILIQSGGLMMTACHVLEAGRAETIRRKTEKGDFAPYVEFYALYVANESHGDDRVGGMWPIDKLWLSSQFDIGFCRLKPARRNGARVTWKQARLSPGVPKIGQSVWGYGYTKMEGTTSLDLDGKESIRFRQFPAFTQGRVIKIHPEYRDRGFLSFPCFQIDARLDPGMSGGPIANESGSVCGVICSSSPPAGDYREHLSYASMIWPALGMEIDPPINDERRPHGRRLLDLVREGYVHSDETVQQVQVLDDDVDNFTIAIEH